MKVFKNFLALPLMISLGALPVAVAGEKEQKEEAKQSAKASMEKNRKVTGTIIDHKVVNIYETKQQMQEAQDGKKNEPTRKVLVTMIKTDKGNERLLVDLGEMDKIPEIKNGETKLKAQGRLLQVGNRQLFVASKAQVGDKTIEIKRIKG